MSLLRKTNLILLPFVAVSLLILGRPSFSETTISERTLASDIVIEDIYQPGSGLPVGKIQSVRGQAVVFHRDPRVGYRVQTGLPLYAGDVLRTRERAWILCRLIDGSYIVLTPKSTLAILRSHYNSSRKMSATALHLEHGSVRFKLKPMSDLTDYDYKVQTEVAVIHAREADFVIQAGPEATEITALENSRLEVTGLVQPEEITFLSDFQRTILSQAIITPTVETLSKEDIEIMMTGFDTALSGNLAAAGTRDEGPDLKSEDTLIEEDIAED